MTRNLLRVNDFSRATILKIMDMAIKLKELSRKKVLHRHLDGLALGLFFEKSSTRTRISFEVGIAQLGGSAIFFTPANIQIERGEPIKDTARVVSRYVDVIVTRTFSHDSVEEWAKYSTIPVINGLSENHHPCQALTDIFTIKEIAGTFDGIKVTYIGDSNNVSNSLLEACAVVGVDMDISSPDGYTPDDSLWNEAVSRAESTGASLRLVKDPHEAVRGADFIYTDVWTSMGMEAEYEERLKKFEGYQLNSDLVSCASSGVKVMHCLPARRGEEITDEVMEGKNSIVFEQAENRLHVQKAILVELLKNQQELA